jgi:hypothetical protein
VPGKETGTRLVKVSKNSTNNVSGSIKRHSGTKYVPFREHKGLSIQGAISSVLFSDGKPYAEGAMFWLRRSESPS